MKVDYGYLLRNAKKEWRPYWTLMDMLMIGIGFEVPEDEKLDKGIDKPMVTGMSFHS